MVTVTTPSRRRVPNPDRCRPLFRPVLTPRQSLLLPNLQPVLRVSQVVCSSLRFWGTEGPLGTDPVRSLPLCRGTLGTFRTLHRIIFRVYLFQFLLPSKTTAPPPGYRVRQGCVTMHIDPQVIYDQSTCEGRPAVGSPTLVDFGPPTPPMCYYPLALSANPTRQSSRRFGSKVLRRGTVDV